MLQAQSQSANNKRFGSTMGVGRFNPRGSTANTNDDGKKIRDSRSVANLKSENLKSGAIKRDASVREKKLLNVKSDKNLNMTNKNFGKKAPIKKEINLEEAKTDEKDKEKPKVNKFNATFYKKTTTNKDKEVKEDTKPKPAVRKELNHTMKDKKPDRLNKTFEKKEKKTDLEKEDKEKEKTDMPSSAKKPASTMNAGNKNVPTFKKKVEEKKKLEVNGNGKEKEKEKEKPKTTIPVNNKFKPKDKKDSIIPGKIGTKKNDVNVKASIEATTVQNHEEKEKLEPTETEKKDEVEGEIKVDAEIKPEEKTDNTNTNNEENTSEVVEGENKTEVVVKEETEVKEGVVASDPAN